MVHLVKLLKKSTALGSLLTVSCCALIVWSKTPSSCWQFVDSVLLCIDCMVKNTIFVLAVLVSASKKTIFARHEV